MLAEHPARRSPTHDELLAVAQEAAAQVTAWQARLVDATAELMETECTDPWRPYLAWTLGLTGSEAGEIVELVDRLEELPRTHQVLRSGERSLRTVLAISRRATPELESTIIESTEHLTGTQLERALREYAKVTAPAHRDEDADADADADPPPSSARWGWRDGRFHLHADFDTADGAALQAWLESERERLDADGAGSPSAAAATDDAPAFIPPRDRSCADALLSLGERATATRANDVGFLPDSAAVNVVVHARESGDGLVVDRAFVPGAGPVPHWALPMLAERGTLTTTVMLHGEPIMATSPGRFATAEQRRALLARDGGCAYPDCGAARRLIAHHIRYVDDGGPTELRNLVLLCRRHHRTVHRHALRITPDPDAPPDRFAWRFHTAEGQPITPDRPWPGNPRRIRTGERRRGSGERLTFYGLDVTVSRWLERSAA